MSQETYFKSGLVRFSYAHVHEPHAVDEGGEKKYSVSILIPKKDKAQVKEVKRAIQAVIDSDQGKAKFGKTKVNALKLPLRDGDEERDDDPAYEGMLFFNASSKNKPTIVDKNRKEIFDDDDFYSGCWGRVSVNFYPFNTSGNKGVAAGLNNLQKLKDDERLSGGLSAEEDFDDDFDYDDEDDDLL